MNQCYPLSGYIQHYNWGKPRDQSLAAALSGTRPIDDKPCAELWFGTHPKGPTGIIEGTEASRTLASLIESDRDAVLGPHLSKEEGEGLPFLFKILSINADFGLSIQAHPDKERAALLHARDPEHYPDANHKPEIAIPVSEVTLLHGFRTVPEIRVLLESHPEIAAVLGEKCTAAISDWDPHASEDPTLRRLFRSLFDASRETVTHHIGSMLSRLAHTATLSPEDHWALRLSKKYGPGDIGLACIYIMKLITVPPGKAIYTGPDICHAYLDGDLLECMANSDNVVRAGLTTKFRDVDTLCEMLIYDSNPPQILAPIRSAENPEFLIYPSPADEFLVEYAPKGSSSLSIRSRDLPSIVFCLDGSGTLDVREGDPFVMEAGSFFFIPAAVEGIRIERDNATIYRIRPGRI